MRTIGVTAALLLQAIPSFAAAILSSDPAGNLAVNPVTATTAFTINGNPVISAAAGFTIGTTAFTLTSATVQLGAVGIASFPTSDIQADLFSGATDPSGSPLTSFSAAAGTVSGQHFGVILTPLSAVTLQASTTYWLVLHPTSNVEGNLGWEATTIALPLEAGATYVGTRQSVGFTPPTTAQPNFLVLQVDGIAVINGSTVPEPATVWLLGAGLACLGYAGRRRLRSIR